MKQLRDAIKPPEGYDSWQGAVEDAFLGDWDAVSNDLTDSTYREQYLAPEVAVRPSTAGLFDPAALVQLQQQQQLQQQLYLQQQHILQQQQHQPQALDVQQMLLQQFQNTMPVELQVQLQQHMLQQAGGGYGVVPYMQQQQQ